MGYFYGTFQIDLHSAGLGYYVVGKDLDFPTYKPTLAAVARQDVWKVSGWQLAERQIQVDIVVVGSSRIDCIARKDTLEAALALRDQQLVLHEDGRYWIANATAGKVKFAAGQGIVQAKVPVTFLCASAFAVAASAAPTYDSGSLLYTASGGAYVSPVFTVAGGGTAYSWPQIHLVHKTPAQGSCSLSAALSSGQQITALSVGTGMPALSQGQFITLYYNNTSQGALWTQKLTVSQATAANATSIPVNSAPAAYAFPVGTTVYVSTAWNQITVAQTTDNYTLSTGSTMAVPLPQTLNDYLDIYCDPLTGMYIATNGLSANSDPVGAFPPLEAGNTQWQITVAADFVPTVDFQLIWTARWLS